MQEASSQAGTKRSTERKKEDTFGNVHAATLTELEKTENFYLLYLISSVYTVFVSISHKITCNINNGYGTICGDKRKACLCSSITELYWLIIACTVPKKGLLSTRYMRVYSWYPRVIRGCTHSAIHPIGCQSPSTRYPPV